MRLSLAFLLFLQFAYAQRAVPVDNEQVRVLSVVDPPHRKGAMHEHTMNRVMIYLDPGIDRISYEDGRVTDLKFKAGDVLWSPAGGKHTSENIGEKPFRIVELELKAQGKPFRPSGLDPVSVAPANYKVVLDNEQVRVLRVRVEPRQKIRLHEHGVNRVAVFLTPFRLRVTPEGGQPAESSGSAYEVRFSKPQRHIEENLSEVPFEVIAVELK